MKIGIIGAGYIGKLLAEKLISAGYQIELSNSRSPETLHPLIARLGSAAKAVKTRDAADNEVVFIALRWDSVEKVLTSLKGMLNGKIVVDATNPFTNEDKLLKLPTTSASEIVASYIPGALVVKAFNSLQGNWIGADPQIGGGKRVAFISGDDEQAKATVTQIVENMGFAAVDLGNLRDGAIAQAGRPLAGINVIKL